MKDDFQAEPSRPQNRPPDMDEANDLSFRKPRTGLPGWGWALIAVAVLFLLCGSVAVVGAMGLLLLGQPAAPPAPLVQPLPPAKQPAQPEEP